MKIYKNKILSGLLLAYTLISGFIIWLCLHPVEIIATKLHGLFSHVLLKNPPLTESGMVRWWQGNRERLKQQYNLPQTDENGNYEMIFWDLAGGLKPEKIDDSICFPQLKPPANCIDKNKRLWVSNSQNRGLTVVNSSGYYQVKEDGRLVRREY